MIHLRFPGYSSRGGVGISPRSPREGRGKYLGKALFSDIYQNRGFECSATILQVASKSSLPADPEQSRREGYPGELKEK